MKPSPSVLLPVAITAFISITRAANCVVVSDVIDAGGVRCTSTCYSCDSSIGGFGGVVTATSPQETDRTGYIGQLYEVTSFSLSAPSTNLDASSSMPLYAVQLLDDGTVCPVSNLAQWSFTGPIASVTAMGVVTAANVDQNTPAMAQASLEGWSASLNLMVLFTGMLPAYNHITGQLLSGGNMRLSFAGSNGMSFALDRCYNLSAPIAWVPQVTNVSGVGGALVFTNFVNPATNNFWRIRSVP